MTGDLLGLQGKVALVIGGGQGIGEASALCLAHAGAAVAVVDIEADRAQKVCDEVVGAGGKAIAIAADALDPAQAERVIGETEKALGGLDILITIIGGSRLGGVLELSLEDWDTDFSRNVRYVFVYAQAAARSFIRRGVPGSIVVTATGGALRSMPFRASYGAAKAALVHLVKSMAVELGEYGVRINAVAPGATFSSNAAGYMDTPAFQAEIEKIPLGRLAQPDDVARGLVFLASDMARHITGSTLAVDGGSTWAPLYDLRSSKVKARRKLMAQLGLDQDR
ncbi:MAG: SDR family oxidoreductase [Caulobacteraceae bacterium]|nr:SDR family oxidoreductase [Caulobacteraceae bacterium]